VAANLAQMLQSYGTAISAEDWYAGVKSAGAVRRAAR